MPSVLRFIREATWRMLPAVGFAPYSNNGDLSKNQHNSPKFTDLNLSSTREGFHICHQFIPLSGKNSKFDEHISKIQTNSFKDLNNSLPKSFDLLSSNSSSEKHNHIHEVQKTIDAKDKSDKFRYNINNVKSNTSSSTLSLHIAAYEANVEAQENEPLKTLSDKNSSIVKSSFNKDQLEVSPIFLQSSLEFPRQQENNDDAAKPEISQFSPTQKLLNPNQQRPAFVSPFRKYYAPTPEQQIHNLRTENQVFKGKNEQLEAVTTEQQSMIDQLLEENRKLREEKEQMQTESTKEIRMLETRTKVLVKENLSQKNQIKEFKAEKQRQQKNLKQNEQRQAASNEKEKKKFEDYSAQGQRESVKRVWNDLIDRWGEDTAKYIIDKLNHDKNDKEIRMLSPLETLHIIKKSQMTYNSFKIMIHELKHLGIATNIFSTYYSVLKERKRITENFKTEIKKVKMRANADSPVTEVDVIFLAELERNFQDRIDETCSAGNYKARYYNGQEEIWWALMADKGKDISKLVAANGNTKKPINSPFNLLYLLMFAMDDSQFNIEAAFKLLSPSLKGITHLIVTENGIQRRVPVRFFFIGDYKIQKGAGGIRTGRCKNPCVKCTSPEDTTFEKFDLTAAVTPREIKIDKAVCQDHMPVFDWIPLSHYIPPPLHSTMAFAGYFFELIYDIAMSMDAKNSEFESVANVLKSNQLKIWKKRHESLAELKEELHAIQDYLNCFEEFEQRQPPESLETCGSPSCISNLVGSNVPFEPTEQCEKCNELFHECCMWYKKCPVCTSTKPTQEQSLSKIQKEKNLTFTEMKKMEHKIETEEKEIKKFISDNKLGPLAQEVEKVLEKNGGTKKAFFQAYTGVQLTTMASKIDDITTALPTEITADERYQHIVTALKLFYQIKLLMMGEELSDDRIDRIDVKMQEFVEHLKTNLPDLRVKQKGHYWIIHGPEFIHEFKFGSLFNEEAVENGHKVINNYDRRIKTRDIEKRLEYLMRCTREDNVIFDRIKAE